MRLTFDSFATSPVIQILVGLCEQQKEFSVHEKILCDRSKFFANALNGSWTESATKVIKLPEDSLDIFMIYLHLIYNQFKGPSSTRGDINITQAAHVYVLAEKLLDDEATGWAYDLLNDTLMLILDGDDGPDESAWENTLKAVTIIYDGTMADDRARKLLVDIFSKHGAEDASAAFGKKTNEGIPQDFLMDLSITLLLDRPPIQSTSKAKSRSVKAAKSGTCRCNWCRYTYSPVNTYCPGCGK